MKRILGILTAVAFLVAASAQGARADSDGYFCIGNGYVAYQFSSIVPPAGTHRLYIVRFGADSISQPVSIDLPQFTVHGMRCRGDGVDVTSFHDVYTVEFDAAGAPQRHRVVPLPTAGALPPWARGERNLGLSSRVHASMRTDRYELEVNPDGSGYNLEVRATPDSVRECPHKVSAHIVQVGASGSELRSRQLMPGIRIADCVRTRYIAVDTGSYGSGPPEDIVLDALVFGAPTSMNVSLYSAALRKDLTTFLMRADSYRSTRPPRGGHDLHSSDLAWLGYERRFFAVARADANVEQVVKLVEALAPCYEWEGYHDCPEKDATFADSVMTASPTGPFAAYMPLFAAHRWLCTAEAYDYEQKPAEAARSMRLYRERLNVALASRVLMFRVAAERLGERGKCMGTE